MAPKSDTVSCDITDPVVTDSCREFESANDSAGASSSTSDGTASLAEAQVLI